MKHRHHPPSQWLLVACLIALAPARAQSPESPGTIVSLETELGSRWLRGSMESASFFKLMRYFNPQKNLAYCGVASSVMVLNALPVPKPKSGPHAPFAFFTQENFFTPAAEAVRSSSKVTASGMSLTELSALLNAHEGVSAAAIFADRSKVEDFRATAREQMKTGNGFVIINYLRKALGQEAGGHISPLGAYHEETDRFLILDVSQYKYPPVWVPTALLWSAMSEPTGDSKRSRGFVVVKAKQP